MPKESSWCEIFFVCIVHCSLVVVYTLEFSLLILEGHKGRIESAGAHDSDGIVFQDSDLEDCHPRSRGALPFFGGDCQVVLQFQYMCSSMSPFTHQFKYLEE